MKLTTNDRERIADSVLKIQWVRASLDQIEEEKIPKLDKMEECLQDVDHGLREVLGYPRRAPTGPAAAKPRKRGKGNRPDTSLS